MAFVVLHDDPRLLANIAQGVGAYRAFEDQDQRDFRDRAFGRQLENDAYARQRDAIGDAERVREQGLRDDYQRRSMDQDMAIEQMRLAQQQMLRQQQEAARVQDREDEQQFRADQAQQQRGFRVMQDVGGRIGDWVEGAAQWFTGNTQRQRQDAREREITQRAAAARADAQMRAQQSAAQHGARLAQQAAQAQATQQRHDQSQRVTLAREIIRRDETITPEQAIATADALLARAAQTQTDQPSPVFGNTSYEQPPPRSLGGVDPIPGRGMGDFRTIESQPPAQAIAPAAAQQSIRPGPGQAKMQLADGRIVIVDKATRQIIQVVPQ